MRTSIRLFLLFTALALPALARAGQPPSAALPTTGSYVATGSTAEADLARLRTTLLKIAGVEQVGLLPRPGGVILHIRGAQTGTLFATAARSVGFELRTMRVRSFLASGSSAESDLKRLREALTKADDVEQVDLGKSNGATLLRIRGEAAAPALAAVAKTVGFQMFPVNSYVASGPMAEADLARLRTALGKVSGVEKVELRAVPGGASVVVQGDVADAALAAGAKSTGFGLLPVSDAGGAYRFRISGVETTGDEEKLRQALLKGAGAGELHFLKTQTGIQLDIIGSTTSPEKITAVAKEIGVSLTPLETITALSVDANGERITPPAPGERTLEELAKMGEIAPDFTLILKDGKSKITLSDYRGKKPVVLIFGSYT